VSSSRLPVLPKQLNFSCGDRESLGEAYHAGCGRAMALENNGFGEVPAALGVPSNSRLPESVYSDSEVNFFPDRAHRGEGRSIEDCSSRGEALGNVREGSSRDSSITGASARPWGLTEVNPELYRDTSASPDDSAAGRDDITKDHCPKVISGHALPVGNTSVDLRTPSEPARASLTPRLPLYVEPDRGHLPSLDNRLRGAVFSVESDSLLSLSQHEN
jgi:hypothetical protein